jgi:hypothetical protein
LGSETLALASDVHVFLPLAAGAAFECDAGTELVHVASSKVRGERFLVRDETFLRACADGEHSLRWTLTPQYLSRRIFLHHDATLLSTSGDPVSWFHTTMFDTAGLLPNQDGESVFKMSYNSRTEINVCYDVKGDARVRFAETPRPSTRSGRRGKPSTATPPTISTKLGAAPKRSAARPARCATGMRCTHSAGT